MSATQNRRTSPGSRAPHDYQIDKWEKFLEEYRYSLMNTIHPEEAIDYLRDNKVLDHEDEEKILSHKTSTIKAGALLDIVGTRGTQDFNHLMEFMEYEHPEIFEKVTQKRAREPDKTIYCPSRKRSLRISNSAKSAITKVFGDIESKLQTRLQDKLADSRREVEAKIEEIQRELEMRDAQISELNQKVLEVTDRNKELSKQSQEAQNERMKAVRDQEMYRRERDAFHQQLMDLKDEQRRTVRSIITGRTDISQLTALQEEVEKLRQQLEKYKVNSEKPECPDLSRAEIMKLQLRTVVLEDRNKTLQSDGAALDTQLTRLAEAYDCAESDIGQYKNQIGTLKAERDKVSEQYEALKRKHDNLQLEVNGLHEKLDNKASNLRMLQTEADIGKMRERAPPIVKELPKPRSEEKLREELEAGFTPFNDTTASCEGAEASVSTTSPTLRTNHPGLIRKNGAVLRQISREQGPAGQDGTASNKGAHSGEYFKIWQ